MARVRSRVGTWFPEVCFWNCYFWTLGRQAFTFFHQVRTEELKNRQQESDIKPHGITGTCFEARLGEHVSAHSLRKVPTQERAEAPEGGWRCWWFPEQRRGSPAEGTRGPPHHAVTRFEEPSRGAPLRLQRAYRSPGITWTSYSHLRGWSGAWHSAYQKTARWCGHTPSSEDLTPAQGRALVYLCISRILVYQTHNCKWLLG